MSFCRRRNRRRIAKNCQSCQERKARFRYRGVVRADRDHTLCFECYRAERDRRRARLLVEADRRPSVPSPFAGAATPSERRVAHRRAMLAHFERQHRLATTV